MFTRVVTGRARVVREVRAAGPLMAALEVPVTARPPWLTAVLNVDAARRRHGRPVAVVVEPRPEDRPEALGLLRVRRRRATTVVTILGADVPVPGGRPPTRLPARTPQTAGLLADGIAGLVAGIHGPWALRLAGLPLGDPTLAALADRLPTAALRTVRSATLVDELDGAGGELYRSTDPRAVERRLPELLAAERDPRARLFLRTAARLHAATGRLEIAVTTPNGPRPAGLLTLLDGDERRAWWAPAGTPGLRTEMGSPLVALTAQGGARFRRGLLSPRTGAR